MKFSSDFLRQSVRSRWNYVKVMLSFYGRFKVTLEISAMSCYFYIMIKRKISEGLSQKYKSRICHLDMHFQNIMIPLEGGSKMKIIEKIFDSVLLLQPDGREDSRGTMQVFFSEKTMVGLSVDFKITEQRIYRIPKRHTFFGIHYQTPEASKGKLISVVQGKALDYIVDLRPNSKTYKQYKSFELNEGAPLIVFIPAGFGHGFLTLEDNTIQFFALDADLDKNSSGIVNYKDLEIGLKLPVEDIIISDYDKNAD